MKSQKKLRVGILGASGRMGQEVKKLILESNSVLGPELQSENFRSFLKEKNKNKVDVWVDFSTPQVLAEFLDYLAKNPAPLVSGTTGLDDTLHTKMKTLAKKSPVFWAPNMSVGVALVARMLDAFKLFDQFDFQIDETHHQHKKDKPSGTALFLQERLQSVVGHKKLPEPLSTRGGGVFGVHRIQALSDEEVISIEHTALNRRVFAKGALWAAQKIVTYKSGYFQMKDFFKA